MKPESKEQIMNTQATITAKAARKAVYDKIESQIHTFEAQVATLRAKAESAKADAQLTAIANLATAKRALDEKAAELKNAGEVTFERRRTSHGGARQVAAGARLPDQRVTTHADTRAGVGDLHCGRGHRRRLVRGDPASVRTRHRVGGNPRDCLRSAAAELVRNDPGARRAAARDGLSALGRHAHPAHRE